MYSHTLHHGKKTFVPLLFASFSTEEILKHYIRYCFKIKYKQKIIMPKKGKYFKFKNYEKKNKVTIYSLCRF